MPNKLLLTFLLSCILLCGCAGPNPNPGERTVDVLRNNRKYEKSIEKARPLADKGYPWAQVRMGLMYERGLGVEKNIETAIEWYKKAADQKAAGNWAEGLMIGATGPAGYFNQNSDARVAQFQLANIYLERKKGRDLIDAYININLVKNETAGKSLFFCCEFAGGYSIPASQIDETYAAVLKAMSPEQIKAAKKEMDVKSK